MPSTIRDIARTAQVSPATVSLVLNGKGGISPETRARVLDAVTKLNYTGRGRRPAKSQTSKTLLFLKIAKHGHTVNRDHSTFIGDYIDGMSQEADRRGYKLEIVSYEGVRIEKISASLMTKSVSGVIILGTELSEGDIRLLQHPDQHTVFIDTYFDLLEANFVNMNNKDAVHKILSHLVEQGVRKIGFVASNVETTNFELRLKAFLECTKLLGISARPEDIITVDSTFDGAYRDMSDQLRRGFKLPDCFVCTNDIIAYGCMKALREFNVTMPGRLSIVGFDNLPMSEVVDPPLTTIDVSKRKIGCLAVDILDDLIRATESQPAVKAVVGANLIVRSSVAGLVGSVTEPSLIIA
jgi:LacI family transcriptional regulator